MPKGIPLTQEAVERRRRDILAAAIQLFIEKGFNEASMREIGKAAGVGKSTLYDYFPAKEDILIAFVVDEVRHMTTVAEAIIAQELSVTEKIQRIMREHLEYLAANKLRYLRLSFEAQRLSKESQQRFQKYRYAYQDMLCRLVEEGIQKGELRKVNPLLAIRTAFTMLLSAVFTSRPTGTLEEMLVDVMDIIFKGLEA